MELVRRKSLESGRSKRETVEDMQGAVSSVTMELEGWTLFWALLKGNPGSGPELMELRKEIGEEARSKWKLETLSQDPTVSGLRRLFRQAGCDPTRYRPSSEALIRRILKGEDIPEIHPLVDLNNCLSVKLAVPCCVMVEEALEPPYMLRAGRPGESYLSMRGPFSLEGKPLLCDSNGPLDAPITGSEKVKVRGDTKSAWLVAYLPREVLPAAKAETALVQLVKRAPVVSVARTCST